ncbi:MAG TPA: MFS transporter [Gemmatimonadales bacterium]|nr:MFS transporter [Gemmatimonadales bacterium]
MTHDPRPTTLRGPAALTRALRHRNYRLFFGGQGTSLVGTWITRIATSWLVYRLTGSALLLGLVGFAGQIPTLVLAPLAGVLVDRWDRHRILVWTQVLSMLQSLALALLTLPHLITVSEILALQLVQGAINAFDTPARQSLLVDLLEDRADLPNAIALNSSMVNLSRIIGPSIGGVLIAAVGEGWCFMTDAVSYLAVIGSLFAMRLHPTDRAPRTTRFSEEFREGLAYVVRFPPVRAALLLLALVATMGMPYVVLMPEFAAQVFHGGPHTLGFLMTASGAGALVGALYLASRHTVRGLWRVIAAAAILFGVALSGFALARTQWLALVILPLVGAGMMVAMAAVNTIVQTMVEERLRGRVMAFYAMAFLGTAPIGSLIAGVVADRIGAPHTVLLGGLACIIGGIAFLLHIPALRPHIRQAYAARGVVA